MVAEPAIDQQRRAALLGLTLRALVAAVDDHFDDVAAPSSIGVGVALLAGDTAWVLVDGSGGRPVDRSLGPVLAWATRQGAARVRLVAQGDADVVARRAALFTLPVDVHRLEGRSTVAVPAAPYPVPGAPPPEHADFAALIEAAGALPVVEHGVLTGEVAGLEVCRATTDAITGVPRLEVGVGANDRETFQMLHGERPTLDALRDVVAHVAPHRSIGARPHPLNLIAASRLLRARVLADPALLGPGWQAAALAPVEPPVKRVGLNDDVPCAARTSDGSTVVVCSSGVDLDVVPFAADSAQQHGAQRAVVAVPARDALGVQHRLAALVRVPTVVVALPVEPTAP